MRTTFLICLSLLMLSFTFCTNENSQNNPTNEAENTAEVVLTNQDSPATETASISEPATETAENTEPESDEDSAQLARRPKQDQAEQSGIIEKKTEEKPVKEVTQTIEIATINQKEVEQPNIIPANTKSVESPLFEIEAKESELPLATSHEDWDALLQKYVSASGKVNYKGFKSDKAKLDTYCKKLENNVPQSNWSRNEKLAYYINAYNAFTVKLIVDNYPTSSITKLKGGKPWDVKWIKLGSKTYTLNNIENDIIRPTFKEPRIHFAVNCAAKSCPPLLNRAWTASNLNRYFESQTKAFINNTKFNKISANSVQISKIFEWYAGDFGDIITYLNKYSNTKINAGAKVSYLEYDWALNE